MPHQLSDDAEPKMLFVKFENSNHQIGNYILSSNIPNPSMKLISLVSNDSMLGHKF